MVLSSGFIEPENDSSSFDDDKLPAPINKVYPLPSMVESEPPPSYDAAVAQERAQRKLIGAVLLKTSHLFGMHPFKPPMICNGDFCQRIKWRDRICVSDLVLCIVNLLVIFNHLRLHLWQCHEANTIKMFSTKTLESILHFIESALPFICVIGMLFCSYQMEELLRCLTDAYLRIVLGKGAKLVKLWRYVLHIITGIFLLGSLLEIPQNFTIELRPPSNSSDGIEDINEIPLGRMSSCWDKMNVFVDRYYYPIMNFGVVKVPQLFIMMIAIRIAVMFWKQTCILKKSSVLTKKVLENFFSQLMEIIHILNMLESCFSMLILAIVSTSVVKIIFTSYGTLKAVMDGSYYGSGGVMTMIKDMGEEAPEIDGVMSLLITLDSTCSVFGLLLNIFWVVIFIIPCIYANELSRSALPVITAKLVADDAKNVKDQIIQKLMDPTWGLTLGRFMKVDRALAMTLMSAIFTIVVVWLQLTIPTSPVS